MAFGYKEIYAKKIKFEQIVPYMLFYRFKPSDWRPSWKYANEKLPLGEI